jgi:hypothetical protein
MHIIFNHVLPRNSDLPADHAITHSGSGWSAPPEFRNRSFHSDIKFYCIAAI